MILFILVARALEVTSDVVSRFPRCEERLVSKREKETCPFSLRFRPGRDKGYSAILVVDQLQGFFDPVYNVTPDLISRCDIGQLVCSSHHATAV